jgi:cytidyltransferase-like protein
VRFLEEAAKLGQLHAMLWDQPDGKFPLAERRYFLEALQFIHRVTEISRDSFMTHAFLYEGGVWVWPEWDSSPERVTYCTQNGISYHIISHAQVDGFPSQGKLSVTDLSRTRVIVTGCYDYFHSGHIRFFEEASSFGDLYVVVGNDANVRLLKGAGHPQFSQDERRYLAGSVRFVHQALVSTGSGWMDATPEIELLRPNIYIVNEDGDNSEKRQFCAEHGLEYVVLQRTPAPGLPRRSSTDLRGF